MPTPCFITIEGETQGLITAGAMSVDSIGEIGLEGHDDEMLVQQFTHNVTVPTNPQSGSPSGKRVHKPFKFTVALNKAVPLLYNALSSGEKLSNVGLKWYRTSSEGKQENFFTTTLEGAVIVDIECEMPHCLDPSNAAFTQNLTVSVAYRKITWDHIVSGTSGADDWTQPIEA